MTPRSTFAISLIVALFALTTVAADEPRLTAADVRRTADAEARQHADLKSYTRVEPSYDPVSKTWGVIYRLKSSAPQLAGQGVLSVSVDDTTGFASTRFSLATPTPAPAASPRLNARFIVDLVVLAVLIAMLVWSFARKRLKHEATSQA